MSIKMLKFAHFPTWPLHTVPVFLPKFYVQAYLWRTLDCLQHLHHQILASLRFLTTNKKGLINFRHLQVIYFSSHSVVFCVSIRTIECSDEKLLADS